jgi:hypothetical protein
VDYLLHFIIDMALIGAGYLIRTTCQHRGLFPHPARDITLTTVTSVMAAVITVPLVG